jgi:hypothetical protein
LEQFQRANDEYDRKQRKRCEKMERASEREERYRRSDQRVPSRCTDRKARSRMIEPNPPSDQSAANVGRNNPGESAGSKPTCEPYPERRKIERMHHQPAL